MFQGKQDKTNLKVRYVTLEDESAVSQANPPTSAGVYAPDQGLANAASVERTWIEQMADLRARWSDGYACGDD